jgi:3-deoxy-manno-octulosonate cytidylyltransferase (CMP-KDO synthetase)
VHDVLARPPAELTTSSVVAIIPARYQSSRFPGKALADLGGRPMIEHVCRRAAMASRVDAVIVATDDARIADAVRAFGGQAWTTRADHATGTDRLAEVAAALPCDIVVNVQGDEPLVAPEAIDALVAPLQDDPSLEMATLARRMDADDDPAVPHVVKVVRDRRGDALYFSRCPIPFVRDGRRDEVATFAHLGLYAYRRATLLRLAALPPTALEQAESLEQLRALEHGIRIRVVETGYASIGVDTPDDLERARHLLAAASAV